MLSPIRNLYPSLVSSSIQGTTIVVPFTCWSTIRTTTHDPMVATHPKVVTAHDHGDKLQQPERTEYCYQNAIVLFQYNNNNNNHNEKQKDGIPNSSHRENNNNMRKKKLIHQLSLLYDTFDNNEYDPDVDDDTIITNDSYGYDSYYADEPVMLSDHEASLRWTLLGWPGETRNGNHDCNLCLLAMTGLFVDVDYLTRQIQSMLHQYRTIYEESNYDDHTIDMDGNSLLSSSSSTTALVSPKSIVLLHRILFQLSYLLREATMYTNRRPFGVQTLLIGRNVGIHNTVPVQPPNQSETTRTTTTDDPTTQSQQRRIHTSMLRIYTLDPSGSYQHWLYGTAIGRNAFMVRQRLFQLLSSSSSSLPHGEPNNGYDALRIALQASMVHVPIFSSRNNNPKRTNLDPYDHRDDNNDAQPPPSDAYEAYLLWHDPNQNYVLKYTIIDPDQIESIVGRLILLI
jgi:20S proteasome alpha/beta subunit